MKIMNCTKSGEKLDSMKCGQVVLYKNKYHIVIPSIELNDECRDLVNLQTGEIIYFEAEEQETLVEPIEDAVLMINGTEQKAKK